VSSAVSPFTPAALDTLLAISRRNNAEKHLTGLLVYGSGNFMQLLEGPRDAVEESFRRIAVDIRHFDVTRIVSMDTQERWCADWSLAYACHRDSQEIEGFRALVGDGTKVLESLSDDNIGRQLMAGFIAGNR
jgi:hypothetical protein